MTDTIHDRAARLTREREIRERAALIRKLEGERASLAVDLQRAQKDGATTAELVEWTGLSRRTVFYMLKR